MRFYSVICYFTILCHLLESIHQAYQNPIPTVIEINGIIEIKDEK